MNKTSFSTHLTKIYLASIIILFVSCGKKDDPQPQGCQGESCKQKQGNGNEQTDDPENPQPPSKPPGSTPPPSKPPTEEPVDPNPTFRGAPWVDVPNSKDWSAAVFMTLKQRLADLELAQDKEVFCPGYETARPEQKYVCWIRIVGGMAFYESDFNPGDAYHEPGGGWSVGLLSLSPGECRDAPTVEMLKKPVLNLVCGINKMSQLIRRDGYIDGPEKARGAAAYWSTLRKPYENYGKQLGKKYEIIDISKKYRQF